MISLRTKVEVRIKKERVRKVVILNLDFQLRKHQVKKDIAMSGNWTIGIRASLTIPQAQLLSGPLHGVARDILQGWHQSP